MRRPLNTDPPAALTLEPLGDQAVLARLPDESSAARFSAAVRAANLPWLLDVVQAYTTVAVFHDLLQVNYRAAVVALRGLDQTAVAARSPRLHHLPCCYGLGLDLERVAAATGLPPEEVVRRHAATEYAVYAIGFCPGFPYLGYLPSELCGVPRLEVPRLRVEAGSVGLTGRQTGIYTEARPGGWNLIGRTPLELVHVVDGYFPLRTGDRVQFVAIGEAEYHARRGERLALDEPLTPRLPPAPGAPYTAPVASSCNHHGGR